MSKYTPSLPYTEEEFADMVQCYIDSGKNIELTKMYYVTRYPGRRRPKPYTLDKVVQKYLKTLESNTTAEPPVDVPQSASVKDERILKYFLYNSHATNKKAASIFNLPSTYIDKLLEDRKADMERMRKDCPSNTVRSEENRLCDRIRRKIKGKESSKDKLQDQSVSEDNSDTRNSKKPDESHICSENSNRETDDDVIYCKTEYPRKRKRKYKKRSVDKKQRTYERVQKSKDLPILETSPMQNPIVYTTRLEEMTILQTNINQFNNTYVINKMLLESKPKYAGVSSNKKEKRSFIRCTSLKEKLKKFERVETHIDLTHKTHTDDEPDETEIIYEAKCYTFNAKEEVLLDMSTKHDVAIVINNLFSNTHDIYATDSKGNVIEYFCTKLNDYMKYVNTSKCRLTFDMCCWLKRQRRVESIWPHHEYPFSRFLTTMHKCPPGKCICCCKVGKRVHTPEVILHKPYDTDIFTVCTPKRPICIYTASEEFNRNLLLFALRYNRPASKRCNNCSSKPKNGAGKRFLFSEFYDHKNIHMVKNEFFEIGSNQEIVRFHVDSHVRHRARCIPCAELTTLPGEPSCKLEVCCEWKRYNYLSEEYKASNISVNTFRFLKNTLFPHVCDTCKVTPSPETNKSTNLDVIPRIEHSRTYVKPTLVKIGFMAEKQSFFNNQRYIRVKDIARQIPQCSNVIQESKTNETNVETSAQKSTVKMNVRCEQIPEYRFELCDVDIQVATAIVLKFKEIVLTVKEDGKVVASLNSTTMTTTTEEFQFLADILKNIQNHLKIVPLSTGSAINLVVEIDNDKQTNSAMNELFPYKLVDLIKNPPKEMTHNFNKRYNNEFGANEQIGNNSPKDTDINRLPRPSSDLACNSNNVVDNEEVAQQLKEFDRFAISISHSKNCYTESFKSFLKTKREAEKEEISVPKISGVFSLHSLVPSNDLVSPNKTDNIKDSLNIETPIASTSNNDIIQNINNFNAQLQSIGIATVQQATGIIYDPTTKLAQIVNFNPNAFGSSLGIPDTNSSTKNENVDLMKPIIGPGQSNSSLAGLTPILTDTIQALPDQTSQVKPHLPDIINAIPTNNNVTSKTNHTVDKEKIIDEVVELLDSD